MKRVVFVSKKKDQFDAIELMLKKYDMRVTWAETGDDLLSLLSDIPQGEWIHLVVIEDHLPDTDSVSLIKKFVPLSPMTNSVVTGTMDKKEVHDTFEGYGVLMQLSPKPTADDAHRLETALKKIGAL